MRVHRQDHPSTSLFDKETGSFKKKWKDKLPVALVFPNSYYLGMSNLGFQIVHSLLNRENDIVCERIFFSKNGQSGSIESNRQLKDFPIVMFSVSFEQDYPTIAGMLKAADIPPLVKDRLSPSGIIEPGFPLVIGGGVATFINPEPIAPLVDLFVVGEIEGVVRRLRAYLHKFLTSDKHTLLEDMSHSLEGIYVPSLYEPKYNSEGELHSIKVHGNAPERIRKIDCVEKTVAGHSHILTSETEFGQIHLTELGRGCSRSCRFCAAGYVYRKPRLWSAQSVLEAVKARDAGISRIGLLGMEMANPDVLKKISQYLLKEDCSLSFSSLRADMIKGPLLDLLKASNLKTAVIAPDGGSERLRKVINKGISAEDCISSAVSLVKAGISTLKMYFMIGLPTEEHGDLKELVDLVKKVQKEIHTIGRKKGRLTQINLSINSFVPKPWTPFQFHYFEGVVSLKEKIKFLRKEFAKLHNLKLSVDNPDSAYLQSVFSFGDRRLGPLLTEIFDRPKGWKKILSKHNLNPDHYARRQRGKTEQFPWEIIDHGIDRKYLLKEYQRALAGKISITCRAGLDTGKCRKCGVCND